MRFNCGPTYEQKARAREKWHPTFLLLPRRMPDNTCAWLERAERRQCNSSSAYGGDWSWWEYRYAQGTK